MKRSLLALALLTCCSAASCAPTVALAPVKPPAERMDCVAVDPAQRPQLPPEHVIDWAAVVSVPQARTEHETFVRSVRTREGVVAGYVVAIEDKVFVCANDAAWLRDFFARLPDG